MLAIAALLLAAEAAYMIDNVPYHRQITNFACGDASSEMVLHYYGADVDQVFYARAMSPSHQLPHADREQSWTSGGRRSRRARCRGTRFASGTSATSARPRATSTRTRLPPQVRICHRQRCCDLVVDLSNCVARICLTAFSGWWTGNGGRQRLGYAAFGYRTDECWVDELRALIAQDMPVVLLMVCSQSVKLFFDLLLNSALLAFRISDCGT